MATHSSVLAWTIPGMGEPGGLSMGSHRVGYSLSDLAAASIHVPLNEKSPDLKKEKECLLLE